MSLFKSKKKFPTANVPRAQTELNQEYTSLCARVGDLQYKVYALSLDIATINGKILDVQKEGVERAKLDQAAAQAKAAAAKETTNEATN